MGRLGQTFLLFFARGTGPKRSGTVLACFWTESVRVPRFPVDPRDALWSPVARSAVDASRCCTWQRAHRAGPIGRALSGPPWGPLGWPFGPALGWALRAQAQQQQRIYFFRFCPEEDKQKETDLHFWALLPKWLSRRFWRIIRDQGRASSLYRTCAAEDTFYRPCATQEWAWNRFWSFQTSFARTCVVKTILACARGVDSQLGAPCNRAPHGLDICFEREDIHLVEWRHAAL